MRSKPKPAPLSVSCGSMVDRLLNGPGDLNLEWAVDSLRRSTARACKSLFLRSNHNHRSGDRRAAILLGFIQKGKSPDPLASTRASLGFWEQAVQRPYRPEGQAKNDQLCSTLAIAETDPRVPTRKTESSRTKLHQY